MRKTIARIAIACLFVISGCATLKHPPPASPKVYSLSPTNFGTLFEISSKFTEKYPPRRSGFLLIAHNDVAFRSRLALIDHATQSIDAQYFIWQNDETGILLFERLLKAADRGVRVRLLVDDLLVAAKNRTIAAITRHPNFDIKLFNPGKYRDSSLGKTGSFLLYFRELNRRMHNKMFVVDNRMAIIGGRNIGNLYFGVSEKYNFRDLDVLVIGPVVVEISNAFDVYWNADLSYPGSALSQDATYEELELIRERAENNLIEKKDLLDSYPLEPKSWEKNLLEVPSNMHVGIGHFVVFDGDVLRLPDHGDAQVPELRQQAQAPHQVQPAPHKHAHAGAAAHAVMIGRLQRDAVRAEC